MVKVREVKINWNPLEVYNVFKDEINTILLDSSKEDKVLSKFSFIGINPFMIFESKGQEAFINKVKVEGEPFIVLERLIEKYKCDDNDYNNIPLISGAIGYISYDTGRILEKLPDTSDEDFNISDMKFIFYRNIIVFDLENNKQYITSITDYGYNEELDYLEEKISLATIIKEKNFESVNSNFKSNFEKEDYKNAITKLKNYIVSGDVYIANMTQRFYTENQEESFEIYKKLRTINKAPFSAYMNFEDFQVISSSPERFIEINKGKVVTRPIKGTRPRGENEEEDIKNSLELINSEKDRAELLMVVDLERNDLSKVCKPHSVKVTELFKLEKYATVFHLVSTVEGILKDDVSAVKCIRECFPGGSITGTPKIRAMEIIEELEGLKRNLYTGSIGYFDFRGNADFNIAIRTIIKKENKAYFGVGGGITYDSIEEDEYNETLDKARALMRVL
ncbi:MAG: aminodeoxychorismate synthase component I [Clostridium sp.]|uniref:aminodeoxychorismate synthase component I n=1 Tax=Clostridium TaxID=1485 RepID=UPI0018A8CEB3|nr:MULTISPECIES: aminodeoxychorismate synthase component I [Clostridium]MDB1968763.1 aminodeoxychorismate synthase component I [Clostridium tertium]MDU1567790.1 aminodeoxychorismate synthase component I [Clostridium sp.]MDU2459548.1 aminodeoxychorismate synthase component I [Clostridium sp.]MDU3406376.1 aminodeoxychorismate synthase component I [Clostridium sp.]MDU7947855.1 aminodeoxychorismate synthase component I [Clostridium sp.]